MTKRTIPMDAHWLTSSLLAEVPGLIHGFSTRLPAQPGAPADPAALPGLQVGRQVHGTAIWVPEDDAAPAEGSDGLATGTPGQTLAVQTADCVPILIAHRAGRAIAALHAGWRGTVAGIAALGVARLEERFGVAAGDLMAAIGPAIGSCCFEVGPEVAGPFRARFGPRIVRRDRGPKPHVELALANRLVLIEAGLQPEAIEVLDLCTRCREELFHSYRRQGEAAGRQWALVRLATPSELGD